MGKKIKVKKKIVSKKPEKKKIDPKRKVLINQKIYFFEKIKLKEQAKRYAKGNITRLVRLLAHGKFKPVKPVSTNKAA